MEIPRREVWIQTPSPQVVGIPTVIYKSTLFIGIELKDVRSLSDSFVA